MLATSNWPLWLLAGLVLAVAVVAWTQVGAGAPSDSTKQTRTLGATILTAAAVGVLLFAWGRYYPIRKITTAEAELRKALAF